MFTVWQRCEAQAMRWIGMESFRCEQTNHLSSFFVSKIRFTQTSSPSTSCSPATNVALQSDHCQQWRC
jgi:hypothetical protein